MKKCKIVTSTILVAGNSTRYDTKRSLGEQFYLCYNKKKPEGGKQMNTGTNNKYSKFLTVLLIMIVLAIIGAGSFWGYDYYRKNHIVGEAQNIMDQFEQQVQEQKENSESTVNEPNEEIPNDETQDATEKVKELQKNTSKANSSGTKKAVSMGGYRVLGKIEIPKTNCRYPVLERSTPKSLDLAIAFLIGAGLNKPGNTVLVGHNYRNGLFFSNNKKLEKGDRVYITDENGKKISYTIYEKYETDESDSRYLQRPTNGKTEITMSTCTDDLKLKTRIIIYAVADE